MQGWLKRSILLVGIFTISWLAVIYFWRLEKRMPNISEVAFYFFGVPTLVFILVLVMFRMIKLTTDRLKKAQQAAVSLQERQEGGGALETSNLESKLSIGILSAAIRTVHGNSVEELSCNLKSNEARLQLDPDLTDSNGFPILTGRIFELNADAQNQAFSTWLKEKKQVSKEWTVEQQRAIAMGSDVVIELAQKAVTHHLLEKFIEVHAMQHDLPALPILHLYALLPAKWSDEERAYVTEWFALLIEAQGWPAERISLRPEIAFLPDRSMIAVDRLMLDAHRLNQPCFGIVIACESSIGELTVQDWEENGRLNVRSGRSPCIPGEGAAGLLLADKNQAELIETEGLSRIHRVQQGGLTKSAEARGLIDDGLMHNLMKQALTLSNVAMEQVSLISADTDHRSSRMIELLGACSKIFPDLDSATQCFTLATQCGEMGDVASLVTVALGHNSVLNDSEAAICLSNNDEFQRTAVVVSTWAEATTLSIKNT